MPFTASMSCDSNNWSCCETRTISISSARSCSSCTWRRSRVRLSTAVCRAPLGALILASAHQKQTLAMSTRPLGADAVVSMPHNKGVPEGACRLLLRQPPFEIIMLQVCALQTLDIGWTPPNAITLQCGSPASAGVPAAALFVISLHSSRAKSPSISGSHWALKQCRLPRISNTVRQRCSASTSVCCFCNPSQSSPVNDRQPAAPCLSWQCSLPRIFDAVKQCGDASVLICLCCRHSSLYG